MAKATYRIQKVDGRHYFHDGKKYVLIDTGYGRTGSIDGTIGEFKVGLEHKEMLHRFNPTPMPDGSLVGAMLCPQTGYSCLLKNGLVEIDDDARELPKHDWFIPYDERYMLNGRPFKPVVACNVDGIRKTMFFDTGMRMPVIDDESIISGKKKVGETMERIGWLYTSVMAPVYNATFEFPCGLKLDGRCEYDYSHSLMKDIFGDNDSKGFFGTEDLFGKYDVFISAIKGRHGIAIINRK
jgi:hypothetical protein